ncbi:T9SS type A sorting domain-containing protein, partial [Crocinitomicaceae bacterium]|nr:T9SS type A sorting domain-containing protein [Crocinitomicaceae bacterium]
SNVTNYFWYLTDEPFTTTIETSSTASNNYTFPTSGDYAIYLFADGSCKTDGIYLPVTVNDPITASVSVINSSCGTNNGKIIISGELGGDGTYFYSLDGNTYYTSSTFENLPSGAYTVYIATVGDNCEATYNVTVGASSEFTATATGNASVCPGGSTTISATGGSSYDWYDGSTLIASTASVTVTPSTQTQYSCIVTNILGCQTTVYTTVSVVPTPMAPTITPSGSTTICAGATLDLTSSYPTNNSWSTGETSSTISVGTSGTYSLSYLDPSGCSSSTVEITINVTPTINITTTAIEPNTCGTATGSINISGTGSGDLNWTGTSSGSVTGITLPYTISNLAAGSYTIVLTDGNGCTSNSITEVLNDPNPPTIPNITPSGPAVFCDGGQVTLSSSYPSGNNWSEGSNDQTITVSSTGVYSVTYTDASGCSATSTPFTVLVNANPSTPIITASGSTTFCDGQTVLLTSSQGTGNLWSDGTSNQNNPVTSSGSYTVTYTDANGCSSTSNATVVTVNPLPNVDGGPDQSLCEGAETILTGSGNLSYTWDNGVLDGVPFTPVSTATYTGTGLDANGCSSSDQVTIIVNSIPAITIAAVDSVCLDAEVFELVIATPTGGTYAGPGVSNNAFNAATAGVGIHSISYEYTDANGCTNSETIDIEVVECTNSIIETAAVPFEIYPNPTNKNIHIEFNGLFEYELVDSKGRLLLDGSAYSTIDLNVSYFESGIYFVKVTQDQKTYTARVVKQ